MVLPLESKVENSFARRIHIRFCLHFFIRGFFPLVSWSFFTGNEGFHEIPFFEPLFQKILILSIGGSRPDISLLHFSPVELIFGRGRYLQFFNFLAPNGAFMLKCLVDSSEIKEGKSIFFGFFCLKETGANLIRVIDFLVVSETESAVLLWSVDSALS